MAGPAGPPTTALILDLGEFKGENFSLTFKHSTVFRVDYQHFLTLIIYIDLCFVTNINYSQYIYNMYITYVGIKVHLVTFDPNTYMLQCFSDKPL